MQEGQLLMTQADRDRLLTLKSEKKRRTLPRRTQLAKVMKTLKQEAIYRSQYANFDELYPSIWKSSSMPTTIAKGCTPPWVIARPRSLNATPPPHRPRIVSTMRRAGQPRIFFRQRELAAIPSSPLLLDCNAIIKRWTTARKWIIIER